VSFRASPGPAGGLRRPPIGSPGDGFGLVTRLSEISSRPHPRDHRRASVSEPFPVRRSRYLRRSMLLQTPVTSMQAVKAFRSRAGAFGAWPAVFLVVVAGVDLADGRHQSIVGEMAIVPLIAASLLGVRKTAVYGVAALAAAALLGIYGRAYDPGQLAAQVERLVIISGSGLVAVALARGRVRREDRLRSMTSIAETVQQALQPQPPAEVGHVRLAARYRAAASHAHVGGDFYDVRETPWGLRLLIGDVRGKGLDAVRMAGVVMAAFRERADDRPALAELLADLDRAVQREAKSDEEFVTVVLAEVDDEKQVLHLAAAGHPPPMLVRHGVGRLLNHDGTGLPLGLGLGALTTTIHEACLEPGDRLLFYTDGTTEARSGAGEFFPLPDRAPAIVAAGTLDEAADALQGALWAWTGGSLRDDAALLVVEIGPCRLDEAKRPPTETGQTIIGSL
jgi:sigma-B regulation protein RsbU (phosphoserine phosphatase)